MKTCPYCAEDIQDAAIVCRYCQRDQPAPAASVEADAIGPLAAPADGSFWNRNRLPLGLGIVLLVIVGSISVSHVSDPTPRPARGTMPAERHGSSAEADTPSEATFATVIRSTDQQCDRVTRRFFQGIDRQGNNFWNIQCADGAAYVIERKNDGEGSTHVLSCALMRAVGGTCFVPFPQ